MGEGSSGRFRSKGPARYTRARKSFGRHEPPKANPGFRYAVEIFSFLSSHSVFITSCASMPSFSHSAPTSLAKEIFTAWNALQAYLIISAVRRETRQAFTPSGA